MGIEVMRLHSDNEFDTWQARDFEVLEELYALAGEDFGNEVESLDKLEAFLLGRYDDPESALKLSERGILDAAARQIGLTMLLNVDGTKWDIDLANDDSVYYRLPIIRLADDGEECPLSLATAALDRRTGHYISTIVENYQAEYNLEAGE